MAGLILKPVTLKHGERYGKLTVLGRVDTKNGVRWRVGCACGYSGMLVRAREVMSGKVKACRECSHAD